MTSLLPNKTLTDIFKHVAEEVGLSGFDVEIFHKPADLAVCVRLKHVVQYAAVASNDVNYLVENVLRPILDRVQSSPAVKAALRDLSQKLTTANDEISKLRVEVDRLRRFETYYNLTFSMTHGTNVDQAGVRGREG